MNFLWKIKILKTKNNYLIGYIFYVKETFKGVLCVCVCMNWPYLSVYSENKNNEVSFYLLLWWEHRIAATENESPTVVVPVREKPVPAPGHIQT